MTGGYWPAQRAAEIHPITAKCVRCGAPSEDALHLLWTCPANNSITDKRVANTQHLVRQAVEGCASFACFWLRGLLPRDLVTLNTPYASEAYINYFGGAPDTGSWPSGRYYTDASGGPDSQFAILRRCGVGVAMINLDAAYFTDEHANSESPLLWGASAPLPGQLHTVPRAELFAMVLVLSNVVDGATVQIRSDSKVNCDLHRQGASACTVSANSDLWSEFWTLVRDKEIKVDVIWIKGHAEDPSVYQQYQVEHEDLVGNLLADKFANFAAETYRVFEADAFNVKWHYALVQKVQARGLCIFQKVLEPRLGMTPKRLKLPRQPSFGRAAQSLVSQHSLCTISGQQLHCTACLQTSPSGASQIAAWLRSPCQPDVHMHRVTLFANSRPLDVPTGRTITVGRTQLHASHKLCTFKGLYFCSLCGYTASVKPQKLAAECKRTDGKAAIDRVLSLRKGRLPSGLRKWPNEAGLGASFMARLTAATNTGTSGVENQ